MSFDEFREAGAFIDDDEDTSESSPTNYRASSSPTNILNAITPVQRFILAILILVMTCLLGSFCLIASGRIVPPGLF